jgi:hypothetical protein
MIENFEMAMSIEYEFSIGAAFKKGSMLRQ